MNKLRLKQFAWLIATYIFLAVGFFFIGGKQLQFTYITSELPAKVGVLPELSTGNIVDIDFFSSTDTLTEISFAPATYGRQNQGSLRLSIIDLSNGTTLATTAINAADLSDSETYTWKFDSEVNGAMNSEYRIRIESSCPIGAAPTIYYGNGETSSTTFLNGESFANSLCFSFTGYSPRWFGQHYWLLTLIGAILLLLFLFYEYIREQNGKTTIFLIIVSIWSKYGFLIQQLVARDFKTRYKRSILGYLWSFLNPLLTMAVQYVVFSTIFGDGTRNFPVYLLSGIILFNFFSEAVGQGLMSIVGNASLINKVYVPKYIYPVTKVISSSINLFISIIPLLLVTLLTGSKITIAILLLPFDLVCLILFCIGMSLLLSSSMVFFRDTQYLWGIFSLIWMYATPLFYPENILPEQFQIIQKVNPLYHFVKFARTILISGVSPEPRHYVYCLVSAIAICLIGGLVFKKTQDKFILYI